MRCSGDEKQAALKLAFRLRGGACRLGSDFMNATAKFPLEQLLRYVRYREIYAAAATGRLAAPCRSPANILPGANVGNQGESSHRRAASSSGKNPTKSGRSGLRFAELQNVVVSFTNRDVFFAVLTLHRKRWRQRPDALWPILGVARIGIYLRSADELETGLFR